MSVVFRAIALLAIVFAGPALQVYAASDHRSYAFPYEPLALVILRSPLSFLPCAILSYFLAIKTARNDRVGRLGWLGLLCALILGGALAMLGEMVATGLAHASSADRIFYTYIWISIALVSGVALHWLLQTEVSWRLEAPAHAVAIVLPAFLLSALASGPRSASMQLFGAWPALLALVPYALIVLRNSSASMSLVRGLLFFALAMAPIYTVMAFFEYMQARGPALLWPLREAREFMIL